MIKRIILSLFLVISYNNAHTGKVAYAYPIDTITVNGQLDDWCNRNVIMSALNKVKMSAFNNKSERYGQRGIVNESSGTRSS